MAGISEIAGGPTGGRRVRRRHTLSTAGFTLIELRIVIGIIGILVALTLSAVQQASEAARRAQCMSNLHQTGVAIAGFTSAHRTLPPGMGEYGHGWRVYLLPLMGQTALFDRFDLKAPASLPPNYDLNRESPKLANCPSDPSSTGGEIKATSYLGNGGNGVQRYGYNGFFRYCRYAESIDPHPATPHGEVDLGEATLSSDGLPVEVVIAGQSTATAGESCVVRGSLRLDPEAEFTPSIVAIYIDFTKANGDRVTANSAGGEPKPVPGQDHLYQFETTMKGPLKPGTYEVIGIFRKDTFSQGRLEVSE